MRKEHIMTTSLNHDFYKIVESIEPNDYQDDDGYLDADQLDSDIQDDLATQFYKTHSIIDTINDKYQFSKELLDQLLDLALDCTTNEESKQDRCDSFLADFREFVVQEPLKQAEACKGVVYVGKGEAPSAAWHYGH